MKRRIAVFASGTGTNFEAIATAAERGELPAEVVLVVSDRPSAEVVARAARHGIPCFAFTPKAYASKAGYEREIVARLDAAGVDLVCLAGYMRILSDELLGAYGGRIVNIHPSLLPAFKGAHAIQDAWDAGVKVTGVTVHLANEDYDKGPIVAQRAVPVLEGDDIDALEARIHETEHVIYPEVLRAIAEGRMTMDERRIIHIAE